MPATGHPAPDIRCLSLWQPSASPVAAVERLLYPERG